MAAGVTVEAGKLKELAAYLREALGPSYRAAAAAPVLAVDGALTPRAATLEFAEVLESAGPYGQGNPAPRFCLPSVRLTMVKEIQGGHFRCALQAADGSQISAVAFRAANSNVGAALAEGRDLACHVAGRLQRDEWGGRNRIEFQIEDVAPAAKR